MFEYFARVNRMRGVTKPDELDIASWLAASVLGILACDALETAEAAPACNRACLSTLADNYMQQLRTGDYKRLPLVVTFRASANAKAIVLGEGTWKTPANVIQKQTFVDSESGQALIYSLLKLKADNKKAVYAVRLKVSGKLIDEADTIYRKIHTASGQLWVPPDLLYGAPTPPERRLSSEALQAAGKPYVTALENGNVADARFAFRCDRIDTVRKFDCAGAFSRDTSRRVTDLGRCRTWTTSRQRFISRYPTRAHRDNEPLCDGVGQDGRRQNPGAGKNSTQVQGALPRRLTAIELRSDFIAQSCACRLKCLEQCAIKRFHDDVRLSV